MRNNHIELKSGFTLIELLIVVAIIAILAAIAVPNFLEAQVRSKVSRVKSDMRSIATAVEAYMVDYNNYPDQTPGQNRGFIANIQILSTPVAYITSVNIQDPFNPPPHDGWPWTMPGLGTLRYCFYGGWVGEPWGAYHTPLMRTKTVTLVSFGPDRKSGYGEFFVYWWSVPNSLTSGDSSIYAGVWGYKAAVDCLYDPTNGTRSGGDIVRCLGETNGAPQSP